VNLEFLQFLPQLAERSALLNYASAVLVTIAASAYAVQIYRSHLRVNIATWGMIVLIDITGLSLAFATGNSNPLIHIAWVVTDVLICFAALSNRANWKWSKLETISLVVCVGSLTSWLVTQSSWSLYGYLVACFFTLLPQAYQYWKNKVLARKSAWIWIVNSLALVMTILSVEIITPEYTVVTLGLLTLNLAMVLIALK